jgi:hypothetical protein
MAAPKSKNPNIQVIGQAFVPDPSKPAPAPSIKPQAQPSVPVAHKAQSSQFDQWWIIAQNKNKLNPAMKQAVKKHMQSTGHLQSGQFDAGLKHFGVKAPAASAPAKAVKKA